MGPWVSLGFSMVFVVVGALLLWRTIVASERAQDAERATRRAEGRLVTLRGEIVGAISAIEALEGRVRKLTGSFYQLRRGEKPEEDPIDALPIEERNKLVREKLRAQHGLPKIGGVQ